MPSSTKPVDFLKGVIYMNGKEFRAYHVRGDRIESGFAWGRMRSRAIAWALALKAISEDMRTRKL